MLGPPPAFFRVIRLIADLQQVSARVADNVHDFAVTVHHDGSAVTRISGEAHRFPWITCPAAAERLNALVGLAVDASVQVDQSLHCTHMLDLARLAIAHVRRGGERTYNVVIESAGPARAKARIARDGRELFEWLVDQDMVISPQAFAGHLTTGRSVWSREVVEDADLREAGLILRRGLLVFKGRPRATPVNSARVLDELRGVCHSFQPEQIEVAIRPPGFRELSSPAEIQLQKHSW